MSNLKLEKTVPLFAFFLASSISNVAIQDEWFINIMKPEILSPNSEYIRTPSRINTGILDINATTFSRKADESFDFWSKIIKPGRTPLGTKLRAIRKEIVDSGVPLLSIEQIEHELKARRGESV